MAVKSGLSQFFLLLERGTSEESGFAADLLELCSEKDPAVAAQATRLTRWSTPLLENDPYSFRPSPTDQTWTNQGIVSTPETNSSSAAFAVGDTAEQIASGDPTAAVDRRPFSLALPGASASSKVDIVPKVLCPGSRIRRERC